VAIRLSENFTVYDVVAHFSVYDVLALNNYGQGTSLDEISDAFASSPEFQQTYGSLNNAEFVTLVYRNVLGRDPEPGGESSGRMSAILASSHGGR